MQLVWDSILGESRPYGSPSTSYSYVENIIANVVEMNPDSLLIGTPEDRERYYPAICGHTTDCRFVYSVDRLLEILSEDMPREEAQEFFDYNIEGAFVGDNGPIFIYTEFI